MFQTIQRYLLGIGLVYSLVMTGLYLTTSKELKLLQSSSEAVKQALKECIDEKGKQQESNSVNSSVSTERAEKLQSLQQDKDSLLKQLDELKTKKCKLEKVKDEKDNHIADIGDVLSDDIVSLLSANDNKK